MTKANLAVEEWALSRGLRTPYQSAVLVENNGQNLSVGFVPGRGIAVSAVVDDPPEKKTIKAMTQELRPYGMLGFLKNTFHFTFKHSKKDDFGRVMDNAISTLSTTLTAHQIQTSNRCGICLREQSDTGIDDGAGVISPVHMACKQSQVSEQLGKLEDNQTKGNYIFGTVGALIGALLGSIPILLALQLTNTYFAVLFALIPLGAVVGYRLLRGRANRYMQILVILLSLFVAFLTTINFQYLSIYLEEGYFPGSYPSFVQRLLQPDLLKLLFQDIAVSLFFTLLGVAISWSYIGRTNKKEQQQLRQIITQDAVVDTTVSIAANQPAPSSDQPSTFQLESPAPQVPEQSLPAQPLVQEPVGQSSGNPLSSLSPRKEVSAEHLFAEGPAPDFKEPAEPPSATYQQLFGDLLDSDPPESSSQPTSPPQ